MKEDTSIISRRIAVNRLHLTDGRVLYNQVIEFSDNKPLRFYSLTEELPFTEWVGGDYFL